MKHKVNDEGIEMIKYVLAGITAAIVLIGALLYGIAVIVNDGHHNHRYHP